MALTADNIAEVFDSRLQPSGSAGTHCQLRLFLCLPVRAFRTELVTTHREANAVIINIRLTRKVAVVRANISRALLLQRCPASVARAT